MSHRQKFLLFLSNGALFFALILTLMPLASREFPVLNSASALLPLAPLIAVLGFLLVFRWKRSLASAILAAVVGISAYEFYPEIRGGPDLASNHGRQLIVITNNVSTGNTDPAASIENLRKSDADVLLLQETNGTVAPFLKNLRVDFPYHNDCRQNCSLAIFSKIPIDRVRYRFRDAKGAPIGPPLIHTNIHLNDRVSVPIVTLHLSRALSTAIRNDQRTALIRVLNSTDLRGLLLAGDFNLVPWSGGFFEIEKNILPLRRATFGLPTYPTRITDDVRTLPFVPIDHVFVGPEWSVDDVRRLPSFGSDHTPVRVVLSWRG